jgi:hypothetical protein
MLWEGDLNSWEWARRTQGREIAKSIRNQDDALTRLPKTDKGTLLVDAVFQRLGGQIFNPDDITLEDYQHMVEDSVVRGALQVIINSVISRGWVINGGEDEHREFISEMYGGLGIEAIFQRVMSAFWLGFSVAEKVFEQKEDGKWFIKRYRMLPPATILFDVKKNGDIRRVIQDGVLLGQNRQVSFSPAKVNVFTWDGGMSTNFGNPYGTSALKGTYKDWFSKDWIIRFKNRYLELMAGGLTIANAGWLDPAVMHKQVVKAKSSSVITIRQGQEIDFVMPKGDGAAFMESLIYHDRRVRESLGVPSLLVAQDGKFGSGDLGEQHFEIFQQARVRRLQQQLQAWADADIRQIVGVNWGVQREYPRFEFMVQSETDLDHRANLFLKAAKAQIVGTNHVPFMQSELELPVMEIGNPLVKPPEQPNPGGSGSSGDAVQRDSDRGSNPVDMEALEWMRQNGANLARLTLNNGAQR